LMSALETTHVSPVVKRVSGLACAFLCSIVFMPPLSSVSLKSLSLLRLQAARAKAGENLALASSALRVANKKHDALATEHGCCGPQAAELERRLSACLEARAEEGAFFRATIGDLEAEVKSARRARAHAKHQSHQSHLRAWVQRRKCGLECQC